jgi:uncharacterized radical SAM protein YgiQ
MSKVNGTRGNRQIQYITRDAFLPVNMDDMHRRGWDKLDFLLISGDAYVDHPSFGHAIISRCLENAGYRVGVIAQPDWRTTKDFLKMGTPRLGVMITAGNLDSMVNHFTASMKRRHSDSYTPGGKAGMRPDRATLVYCNRARELWKDTPIIIGGIEASLRRFAHYDYWGNNVRRSILEDSRADLLVFGMGEIAVVAIANAIASGKKVSEIRDIEGTCWKTHDINHARDAVALQSYDEVAADKTIFADAFKKYYSEQDHFNGKRLIQKQTSWYVVQNKPARPLTTKEMDNIYALPYARTSHPDYNKNGGVPALEEVKFSITSHRGCFGECSFCAISSHQGRIIQRRSNDSMIAEAEMFKKASDFKGYIHDVGGPTANFTVPACSKQLKYGACRNKSCLFPEICAQLKIDHTGYTELLQKLRNIEGIKKVFIRSGLRYDYLLADNDSSFLENLCRYHISGQLKIAPEHSSPEVLKLMRKPSAEVTKKFVHKYFAMNKKIGLEQYLVPYFISAHPGSTLKSAIELAEFIRDTELRPEQVQDFTPTPGSVSTCMYWSGIDPFTGTKVYVPTSNEERKMQRALLQYWIPENADMVRKALEKAGRLDLIGNGPKCLVKRRHSNFALNKNSKNYGQRK